ncbi:MAG: fenitrothion hydrolase [Actinomycetota bacterium]|nr:fenitrothion hydrolase [Actinomycetota bacterium]
MSRIRPLRTGTLATVLALWAQAILPTGAAAHGIGGAAGLPIPTWLFAWAASIALVASFVGLATLWPESRLARRREHVVARVPGLVAPLCGAVGVTMFALVVYAGFAGEQSEPTQNLAPVFVYVFFWVGLVVASFLFGDIFRAFNPWRATARSGAWLARRLGIRHSAPLRYPRWLGHWPAAAGILVFAWVELIYGGRDDPSTISILALACAIAQLAGMAAFGIEDWESRGDPFSVYFGLFAKLSPLRWRDGMLAIRRPLEGVVSMEVLPGTVALLAVMIGAIAFDGLSHGAAWTEALAALQADLGRLGLGAETALELIDTLGLLAVVGLVAGIYRLGVRGMTSVGQRVPTRELSRSFVHTLVPIALGYVAAHYFTFLVEQGQSVAYLISDPLGNGANLLGTAHATINYSMITASRAWYVEVAVLLAGHVGGLVLAHDRAVGLYRRAWDPAAARVAPDGALVLEGRANDATRSQYWMLAVMVAFTCLGLWLLSQAA